MFCLSAANWWERSPNSSNSTNFCKVNSNGNANNNNASNTNGLAPFGYICDAGEIKEESIIQSYDCWRSYAEKYNSEMTARNMDRTFKELFGKEMHREVMRRMEKRKRRRKNDG